MLILEPCNLDFVKHWGFTIQSIFATLDTERKRLQEVREIDKGRITIV